MVSVLLSAHVESVSVSRMRDFFLQFALCKICASEIWVSMVVKNTVKKITPGDFLEQSNSQASAHHTVDCTLHTSHYTLDIAHFTLQTAHKETLQTANYELYTAH